MRSGARSLTVRTRIAITIFAVSTSLLLLMSGAVYVDFQRQLLASLDDTIRLRAEANLGFLDRAGGTLALRVTADPGGELAAGEAVLRLYGPDGALRTDASPETAANAAEARLVEHALATGEEVLGTVDLDEGEAVRLLVQPIAENGAVAGVLVSGLERSRVEQPLSILRILLLAGNAVTATALGFGSYWIARRALQPVAEMTAAAGRIARGDPHERIAGAEHHDELGDLAATLNAMLARLEETLARERRFTADASHELRTPLSAIETAIDVSLTQERSPEEYQRVLGLLREQTVRLHRLANQLLLLSRLDGAELRAGFGLLDLGELLAAVAESFAERHPDAALLLPPTAPACPVLGDYELLARAVQNLLENAAAHGGPAVRITLELRAAAALAELAVTDDGPGVPPELADEVFGRFRRGDAARAMPGSGLGLAIVASIARVHGGSIRLEPGPNGAGARFVLGIPLAPVTA